MGIVMSRSSVPVVRSRSIVIEVTRNITMKGNSPHSGAPMCWKICGLAVEDVAQQHEQQAGNDEQQSDRARIVADLPEDPLRGGECGPGAHRAGPVVCAASMTARNARARSCWPVSLA